MTPAYRYRATCARVIDGDTFVADVDLGFRAHIHIPVRVRGLWCPELRDEGGVAAMVASRNFITDDVPLIIEPYKDYRSFERWVADVWLEDERSFAAAMIDAGHGTAQRT